MGLNIYEKRSRPRHFSPEEKQKSPPFYTQFDFSVRSGFPDEEAGLCKPSCEPAKFKSGCDEVCRLILESIKGYASESGGSFYVENLPERGVWGFCEGISVARPTTQRTRITLEEGTFCEHYFETQACMCYGGLLTVVVGSGSDNSKYQNICKISEDALLELQRQIDPKGESFRISSGGLW